MGNAQEHLNPKGDADDGPSPCRILLYGPPKTQKTWWALCALVAGYNVVIVDMDDGIHILAAVKEVEGITDEMLERLWIVPAIDYYDNATAAFFAASLVRGAPFYWNCKTQIFAAARFTNGDPYFEINPRRLTHNTVLIMDSWTALAQSAMLKTSKDNGLDLSEAKKEEMRDVYAGAGRFLSVVATRIHSFQCHVIVIGHETEYAKTEKNKITGKEEVVSKKTQIISSSGPHAGKLGKDFSDILHFNRQGINVKIDTQATSTKDSGSRHIPPKNWDFKELTFGHIAERHKWPKPDPDFRQDAFLYHPAGETVAKASVPEEKPVVNEPLKQPEGAKKAFSFNKK